MLQFKPQNQLTNAIFEQTSGFCGFLTVKVVNLVSIKFGDLGLPLIWRELNLAISRFLEKLNMEFAQYIFNWRTLIWRFFKNRQIKCLAKFSTFTVVL